MKILESLGAEKIIPSPPNYLKNPYFFTFHGKIMGYWKIKSKKSILLQWMRFWFALVSKHCITGRETQNWSISFSHWRNTNNRTFCPAKIVIWIQFLLRSVFLETFGMSIVIGIGESVLMPFKLLKKQEKTENLYFGALFKKKIIILTKRLHNLVLKNNFAWKWKFMKF